MCQVNPINTSLHLSASLSLSFLSLFLLSFWVNKVKHMPDIVMLHTSISEHLHNKCTVLFSFLSKLNFMVYALENERTQTQSLSGCWCCSKPLRSDYTMVLRKYHRMPFKNHTYLKVHHNTVILFALLWLWHINMLIVQFHGVELSYNIDYKYSIDNVGSKVNKHTAGLCSVQSLRMRYILFQMWNLNFNSEGNGMKLNCTIEIICT